MGLFADFEKMQWRPQCCPEDMGGSHYHCGNCGKVSGMLGHFVTIRSQKMADIFGKPVGFEGFTCETTSE